MLVTARPRRKVQILWLPLLHLEAATSRGHLLRKVRSGSPPTPLPDQCSPDAPGVAQLSRRHGAVVQVAAPPLWSLIHVVAAVFAASGVRACTEARRVHQADHGQSRFRLGRRADCSREGRAGRKCQRRRVLGPRRSALPIEGLPCSSRLLCSRRHGWLLVCLRGSTQGAPRPLRLLRRLHLRLDPRPPY